MNRQEIIRYNASRRLRGFPTIQVPPKPKPVMGWELTENGDYMGFTKDEIEMKEFLENNPLRKAKKVISIRG